MSRFTGYYRPGAITDHGYWKHQIPFFGKYQESRENYKRLRDYEERFPAVARRGGRLYPNSEYDQNALNAAKSIAGMGMGQYRSHQAQQRNADANQRNHDWNVRQFYR
uniref:Serum amyloid A protein n=1 Tax=Pygoscelis antarcticus TaxID=79643 RepID=A0A7G7LKQ3_PYGAN|nr:hypothetical protein [Pygoscelis antarcticus]